MSHGVRIVDTCEDFEFVFVFRVSPTLLLFLTAALGVSCAGLHFLLPSCLATFGHQQTADQAYAEAFPTQASCTLFPPAVCCRQPQIDSLFRTLQFVSSEFGDEYGSMLTAQV